MAFIEFNRGHLRDENKASQCKFLQIGLSTPQFSQVPMSDLSRIDGKALANKIVLSNPALVGYICTNPAMVEGELTAELREGMPKEFQKAFDRLWTSFEVCRACKHFCNVEEIHR
jgi:hypothetical protein